MKIIKEFSYVFAFSITGLIFGFSFFLLFSNIYSYKEVNSSYEVQDTEFTTYKEMKQKLNSIRGIANSFDSNNYKGQEDLFSMVQVQLKLNTCVDKIDTSSFDKLLTKNKIYIKDNYEMQQYYQSVISDECLVKQLYDLTTNKNLKLNGLDDSSLFLQNEIDNLIKSTDYIQKEIKSNSSYYFPSTNIKETLYDKTRDSYYSLLDDYKNSIDFVYDIALWYQKKLEV